MAQYLYAAVFLAIVGISLFAAFYVFESVNQRTSILAAISAAIFAFVFVFIGAATTTLMFGWSCSTSSRILKEAPKLLTPDELKTLRSTSLICPNLYKFKRDGVEICLGSGGDEVWVGCG